MNTKVGKARTLKSFQWKMPKTYIRFSQKGRQNNWSWDHPLWWKPPTPLWPTHYFDNVVRIGSVLLYSKFPKFCPVRRGFFKSNINRMVQHLNEATGQTTQSVFRPHLERIETFNRFTLMTVNWMDWIMFRIRFNNIIHIGKSCSLESQCKLLDW